MTQSLGRAPPDAEGRPVVGGVGAGAIEDGGRASRADKGPRAGVGTALYAFGVVLESLVEGHLRHHFERRRMKRDIARMSDGSRLLPSASRFNPIARPISRFKVPPLILNRRSMPPATQTNTVKMPW